MNTNRDYYVCPHVSAPEPLHGFLLNLVRFFVVYFPVAIVMQLQTLVSLTFCNLCKFLKVIFYRMLNNTEAVRNQYFFTFVLMKSS